MNIATSHRFGQKGNFGVFVIPKLELFIEIPKTSQNMDA